MSLLDTASLVITPNGTKASTLYSVVPSDGSGDMTVTRATTATRVNSAGLIESVASNVPRLDYSNGTCPSILVEPQRTNLAFYSEQFDNIFWATYQATISANATASPDGNVTADKLIDSTSNDIHANFKGFLISTESTLSYFVKSAEYSRVAIGNFSDGGEAVFNLSTGAVVSTSSNWKNSTITALANGWFKISATTNGVTGAKAIGIQLVNNSGALTFAGTGTSGVYIWGAQLEAGSYATSYIPTTLSSVTRNADVINKTGISSLIGQTEGTLFLDLDFKNVSQSAGVDTLCMLNNGTNNNEITILLENAGSGKTLLGLISNGGSFQTIIYAPTQIISTRYKIALAYKNNDIAFYINGSLIGTDTSAIIPTTSAINFNNRSDGSWTNTQQEFINSTSVWKTRLTNTQLAQLTTI